MSMRGSELDGVGAMARLALRRDRIRLPVWLGAILGVVYASAAAVQSTYSTPDELDSYASTMGSSAAAIAMSGPPVALHTPGGVTVYEISTTAMVSVALMAVLLVIRHTRAEEEAGRFELLRSTVVGSQAPAAAAVLVVGGAAVAAGAGIAAILLAQGLPATGSLLYGTSVAAVGVVFTVIGACAAQVTAHARGAVGISTAVLGASFALRAVGDVGANGLSWVSPFGWSQAVHPYGDERWWPLLVAGGVAVAVSAVVAGLTTRRDVGSGLVPPRPGPGVASPRLLSAVGLAARLQRGLVIGWGLGMFGAGLAFGSFGREVTAMVADNPELAAAFAYAGSAGLVDAFFATVLAILAIVSAGFTVSSVLRLRAEESSGRVEPLLATGLSRRRWLLGNLLVTFLGTVLVLAAAGLGAGLAHGLASNDIGELPRLLASMLVFAPAVLALGSLGVLLFGWLPRAAIAVWAALALCVVNGWLGPLLDLPGWLLDLSPYTHVPAVPVETVRAAPLLLLAAVAGLMAVGGLAGLRRRDVDVS
ncbi:MAG TPA: ABC transporter permease [Nocardioidaceae bacterium]|nr:ABC transporter permease [Nocardioidaceae bacterium]